MIDQTQKKKLTSWFTFFREVWIPYIVVIGFSVFLFASPLDTYTSVLTIIFFLGFFFYSSTISWENGRDDGINHTLEVLIQSGLILAEVVDGDTVLVPAKNVEVYDKCKMCVGGRIYNPSLTLKHNEFYDD